MREFIKSELMKLNVRDEGLLDRYILFCDEKSDMNNYDCVHHIIYPKQIVFFLNIKALVKTMKDGIGVYTKKAGLIYLKANPDAKRFVGWTASYTKYEIGQEI